MLSSSHQIFVGIIALVVFVTVAVLVAGTSDGAAKAVLTLFLGFAALQLISQGSVGPGSSLVKFLNANPIITNGQGSGQSSTK